MAGLVRVIWVCREEEYFCGRDWTGQITLKLLGKIDHSRKIDFSRSGYFRSLFPPQIDKHAIILLPVVAADELQDQQITSTVICRQLLLPRPTSAGSQLRGSDR
jgi:hypothetical protein